jgi:hypothetical protein
MNGLRNETSCPLPSIRHCNVGHTVELRLKIERSRLSSLSRQAIVYNVTARAVVRLNQPLIVVEWRCLPRAPVALDRATSTYPLSITQLKDRHSYVSRCAILCERYHNMERSLDTAPAESQHTRRSAARLRNNVLSIESRHLVGNDAVDVVPDDSERTQQALAGAYSSGAPCGAAMPAQIRRFKAKSVVASEAC